MEVVPSGMAALKGVQLEVMHPPLPYEAPRFRGRVDIEPKPWLTAPMKQPWKGSFGGPGFSQTNKSAPESGSAADVILMHPGKLTLGR